jgi:hypothetical protein
VLVSVSFFKLQDNSYILVALLQRQAQSEDMIDDFHNTSLDGPNCNPSSEEEGPPLPRILQPSASPHRQKPTAPSFQLQSRPFGHAAHLALSQEQAEYQPQSFALPNENTSRGGIYTFTGRGRAPTRTSRGARGSARGTTQRSPSRR